MTKLVSLHVNIPKEDFDFLNAFSPQHGDLTKMVRHLIHTFCKDLRTGNHFVLPPEIQCQMDGYTDSDSEEDSDENSNI